MNPNGRISTIAICRHIWVVGALLAIAACSGSSADIRASDIPEVWEGYTHPDGRAHIGARLAEISDMPEPVNAVLFVGDSITEGADLRRLFPDTITSNHGIGWDQTRGVLTRMDQITRGDPAKIFLLIGTNDLHQEDADVSAISERTTHILRELSKREPQADIHVLGVLPREAGYAERIKELNARIAMAAHLTGAVYLDLTSAFANDDGALREELTYDGLHLNDEGYALLGQRLRPCVERSCPAGL